MHLKRYFSLVLLSTVCGTVFSMELDTNKKYTDEDGNIVSILGDCQETWNINGLVEVGNALHLPAITTYLHKCVIKSHKFELLQESISLILAGDKEAIKACLDEKYHGTFYYTEDPQGGKECIHASWLTPIERETKV